MIDLEAKLARWRREREAIPNFNFKPENLDDLEDELRFEIEHSLKEGATPDEAWVRGLRRIGQSLSTTRDFVQTEFLPALFHLLKSWGKPGMLVILFFGALWSYETTFDYFGRSWPVDAPLAFVSLGVMLVVLPGPTCQKAILLGLGNVAILLPVLYVQLRPHLVESILVPGKPGPSVFGWLSVPLEVGVVIAANLWWWKRQKPGERRLIVGITGTILVILLLAPFCGEVVGLFSIREVFRLPTADEVPWINQAKVQFLQWKFPRVLVDSMLLITTLLPLLLSVFWWGLLRGTGALKAGRTCSQMVPQRSDLPCLMVLFSFGSAWFYSSTVEITFTNQMREAEATLQSSFHFMRGLEAAVLFTAIVYLLSAFEWTRRLRRATEIRTFYAIVVLLVEIGVILGVTFCQKMGEVLYPLSKHEVSGQPLWLSWLLGLASLVLLMDQTRTLWNKSRSGKTVSSQGTIGGTRLVQLGLALGLVLSWAWLILAEVALVMAYLSVAMIQAMVAWGSSISEPRKYHFDPWSYGFTTHSEYGIYAGAFYLIVCLILGLVLVMVLMGLEFLCRNAYRYHQVRQAARSQVKSTCGTHVTFMIPRG